MTCHGPVLLIHGGAGVIQTDLHQDRRATICKALSRALREGYAILQKDGAALDAVTAAVVVLEDAPCFNAGKGAVFTHDGHNELDAAVMRGVDRAAA
ncbi:MAG TPA: isoaspartyl peptidase/L-asparaginase, partial [Mizugakiibacter sp.]|nr:isoaspartyl peptidase/L-asparaginase [Mizugakiibacter sp.]